MHISTVLEENKPCLSFEFFPPKTEKAAERLYQSMEDLMGLKPGYVSVTYGAGGSTRELTHDLLLKLKSETDLTIVSHLTCVGSTRAEIKEILQRYHENGIRNIMALRGDPPKGQSQFVSVPNGFTYASELVGFIKKYFPDMGVGVAGFPEGHPDTPNRLKEIEYLKQKVDEGADYICTQLFFDNRDYYDYCERCEIAGIRIPIVAGIMPITSLKGMQRMAQLSLGSRYPARLLRALARAENDEYAEKVGVHWATEQVSDLIDNGVRGIHFYTLNKSDATVKIYEAIGIRSSDALQKNILNPV
ncbi:MAG: methylenetetrahydrofolate reductase [NAD(P)H] [Spirochaetota bacterium]